ncbi:MAG: BrnA antitoxin family protein [Hyphomicrobiales bacterium]|nr:BrnA antitoxin family protein [Hyphomicrobiales bacterium]
MEGPKRKNLGISDAEEAEIQRQIAEDSDDWVSTDEELAAARPFAEVFPELAESARRARGRPPSENPKKQVTLRLDADVVERFRASGKGWQRRINSALRKAAGL